MITTMAGRFGRDARDRLDEAADASLDGAVAALETFYHAFNNRSLALLDAVWLDDSLVQLNNPLGGILRGADAIRALYDRVFTGPARVWVEFHDIVQYRFGETVVFGGREHGQFSLGDTTVPLSIRTSRVFVYQPALGWRQVHHHGSIDDPDLLRDYQQAVMAPR